MPTFTLDVALLMPLMLPKTKALLAETTAFAPIAVAFCRLDDEAIPGPDREPMNVLLDPMVLPFAPFVVYPASYPNAVLLTPGLFE